MDKAKYIFLRREKYWQEFWVKEKIFEFNPNLQKPLFTVDTPPPTVSGVLHLGHVFSYTQAEVVVRFFRMKGFNVRYPFGFDDNGLPTERLVEKEKGILGRNLKLANFAKICYQVIQKYHKIFEELFRKLGFSVDWRLTYSTISEEVQKLAQTVFVNLYKAEQIYQKESPALYCTECQTSVAQAEVEDKEKQGVFYDVVFEKEDGGEVIISTTRPELIDACVAVFVNPADSRYHNLVGKKAITPFGARVKILTDEKVSLEKGTGVVMCCTYGDETDAYWVKSYNLAEKIILDNAGRLIKNGLAEIEGKTVEEARALIVEKLRKEGKIKAEKKIVHSVGVHERCGTPIEIINTTQWFIKILDKKNKLLELGGKISWYPAYMKKRFIDWVENLKWDWSISRERFFGIPVPIYKCSDCGEIIIPETNDLPLDPRVKKFSKSCPKCKSGKIVGENKVLDTWFTSALTPDINNNSPLNGKLTGKMYPMSIRPQAHDIIRTWALYTIVMGFLNHGQIPWKDLMISGHILLRKGEKISKKKGGRIFEPEELILKYSADAVRYAMCSAALGQDAYFDVGEVRKAGKLITKIYNVGKFSLVHLLNFKPENLINASKLEPTDSWILAEVQKTVAKMGQEFGHYEIGKARKTLEEFFWNDFCDNYLEIVKKRLYGEQSLKRQSAKIALYHLFLAILKMLAPFMPHITEEIYQSYFAKFEKAKSIHLTLWPKIETKISTEIDAGARLMLSIISQVRKYKSDKKISLGTEIGTLEILSPDNKIKLILPFLEDLKGVTKAQRIFFAGQKKTLKPELTVKV